MQPPRDETLQALLRDLYSGDSSVDPEVLSSQLLQTLRGSAIEGDGLAVDERWSGADAVLITYADTVTEQERPGLQSLRRLVNRHLNPFASVIHVLPFLRSTAMAVLQCRAMTSWSRVMVTGTILRASRDDV